MHRRFVVWQGVLWLVFQIGNEQSLRFCHGSVGNGVELECRVKLVSDLRECGGRIDF